MASAICGAGIMALPNAFRVLGLAGGALALIVMSAVTRTTVGFLTRGTRDSGATTYAALVGHHLGPAWRRAVQIAIVLNNFGVMVVYQIIFGDVLAGSRADLRGVPVDPDAPIDPDPDRGDYDNATEPAPLPPSPPPPSHHRRHHHHASDHPGHHSSDDSERGRLRALVPWALERAGGSCRVSVRGDGTFEAYPDTSDTFGGYLDSLRVSSDTFGGYPDHGILSLALASPARRTAPRASTTAFALRRRRRRRRRARFAVDAHSVRVVLFARVLRVGDARGVRRAALPVPFAPFPRVGVLRVGGHLRRHHRRRPRRIPRRGVVRERRTAPTTSNPRDCGPISTTRIRARYSPCSPW